MKILILQDDFPPQSFGGAGIISFNLAKAIQDKGNSVFVITVVQDKKDEGEFEYEGLRIFRIYSKYNGRWTAYLSLYNPQTINKVKKIIKEISPDIVHMHNIHTYLSYHTLKIAKQNDAKVFLTTHDVMSFNYGKLETKRYLENFDYSTTWLDHIKQAKKRWNPFRNIIIRYYLRYVDKIFAVSFALREALNQNGIKNVEVIHNGINLNKWHFDENEVRRFKEKHNLKDKKTLLFNGRLSVQKGGAKVVEALVLVNKEISDVLLLVVGKYDEYARAMRKYAEELGVAKQLIFTGWIERDEIKVVYAISDIVLTPSICFDSFPNINIEAMASRKPVVGTCYGGTPEIVIDGVTGYIVNPLYPEQIAKKAVELLKNPEKAKQFGDAGYERVKKYFNLEDKVNEYIAVYKNFL